jgi:hypothetical protein
MPTVPKRKPRIQEPQQTALDKFFVKPIPRLSYNARMIRTDMNRYHVTTKDYEQRNIGFAGILADYTKKGQKARVEPTHFLPPYTQEYKARLANCWEFDHVVRGAIEVLIEYVFGRGMKSTIYPVSRDQLKTEEEVTAALTNAGISQQEAEQEQKFLDTVDLACELETHARAAYAQAVTFGNAALWIERAKADILDSELAGFGFKEGTPTQLKPLSSYYLWQTKVDPNTWDVLEIEYLDGQIFGIDPSTQRFYDKYPVPIDEIIYFTRNNNHVPPNTYGYGFSDLQPILALSEANRRINEEILNEINTAMWSGSGLWTFQGLSTEEMQIFIDNMQPGLHQALNQNVQFQEIKLQYDIMGLLEQRDRNTKQILMMLNVPGVVLQYSDIGSTARATAEVAVDVWQATKLEAERNWLRLILNKYWYGPLAKHFFMEGEDEESLPANKKFLELRQKVMLEFINIEFKSPTEMIPGLVQLYDRGIITEKEIREQCRYPPFAEEEEERQEETRELEQEVEQAELERRKEDAENPPEPQPQQVPPPNGNARIRRNR